MKNRYETLRRVKKLLERKDLNYNDYYIGDIDSGNYVQFFNAVGGVSFK